VQVSDRIDILVPEFGHGLTDALVVEWRVSVGDAVERGDVVAVLETDKSSVDLMAERAGTVVEIAVDARSITTQVPCYTGSTLYRLDDQPRKATADVTER
jgi:pyruvate dehydrogenase E2 component (dihydrolipoamide acetyltransferase)